MHKKRGLSPVIATTLLIVIVVIVAIVIFWWARSFVGESIQKDLGSGPQAIETVCEQIDIDAEAYVVSGIKKIDIVNRGNVPIWSLRVNKLVDEKAQIEKIKDISFSAGRTLSSGDTYSLDLSSSRELNKGDKIQLIPLIIGESGNSKKAYPCENAGVIVEIN